MLDFISHKNVVVAMSVSPFSLAIGLDRLYTKPTQICVIFHFIKESIFAVSSNYFWASSKIILSFSKH